MYDDQWHRWFLLMMPVRRQVPFTAMEFSLTKKQMKKLHSTETRKPGGGRFQQAANISGDYAGNTWMSGFPGAVDQLKFYSEVLSAAEVATNYTNHQ